MQRSIVACESIPLLLLLRRLDGSGKPAMVATDCKSWYRVGGLAGFCGVGLGRLPACFAPLPTGVCGPGIAAGGNPANVRDP